MLGGADNPNGELPSYITGADMIGVNLPDKRTEFTQRLLLTRKISGSVMKK
ncbi:hypothetical protein CHI23_003833 [Salmonella enterica subsp. enterica serovar Mississippi]|nr:hypothetical protein [Salmonella enterica subsp. enterica serovar Mississippi]